MQETLLFHYLWEGVAAIMVVIPDWRVKYHVQ